jgi:hypothetical protein
VAGSTETGAYTLDGDTSNLMTETRNPGATYTIPTENETGMTWTQGEFTGSGTVDINDLTIVLQNFGQTASVAGMALVPKPSTITLLLAGAACLAAFAWRRRA